eukprot:Awhi_evm1s9656
MFPPKRTENTFAFITPSDHSSSSSSITASAISSPFSSSSSSSSSLSNNHNKNRSTSSLSTTTTTTITSIIPFWLDQSIHWFQEDEKRMVCIHTSALDFSTKLFVLLDQEENLVDQVIFSLSSSSSLPMSPASSSSSSSSSSSVACSIGDENDSSIDCVNPQSTLFGENYDPRHPPKNKRKSKKDKVYPPALDFFSLHCEDQACYPSSSSSSSSSRIPTTNRNAEPNNNSTRHTDTIFQNNTPSTHRDTFHYVVPKRRSKRIHCMILPGTVVIEMICKAVTMYDLQKNNHHNKNNGNGIGSNETHVYICQIASIAASLIDSTFNCYLFHPIETSRERCHSCHNFPYSNSSPEKTAPSATATSTANTTTSASPKISHSEQQDPQPHPYHHYELNDKDGSRLIICQNINLACTRLQKNGTALLYIREILNIAELTLLSLQLSFNRPKYTVWSSSGPTQTYKQMAALIKICLTRSLLMH